MHTSNIYTEQQPGLGFTRTDVADGTAGTQPKVRLHYLDGLRGLSALYVVMCHAYLSIAATPLNAGLGGGFVRHATDLLNGGRAAVIVFIVLSGYCLMIPVVRSSDGRLPGGTANFVFRRARRILPPYYAALFICLGLIEVLPALGHAPGTFWSLALPAFTPKVVIAHLFLVHNLFEDCARRIDYPMWSVATEWQIYFFLPLILLPIWRRYGMAPTVATAAVIGLMPFILFPRAHEHLANDVAPHFLLLFSFGMTAAQMNFSTSGWTSLRGRVPWGIVTLGLLILFLLLKLHLPGVKVQGTASDVLDWGFRSLSPDFCTEQAKASRVTVHPILSCEYCRHGGLSGWGTSPTVYI